MNENKKAMSYQCKALVNEYGTDFGWEYTIDVLPGQDPDQLCQKLIEEVIGEERYYRSRDVWDQIRIEYNYL